MVSEDLGAPRRAKPIPADNRTAIERIIADEETKDRAADAAKRAGAPEQASEPGEPAEPEPAEPAEPAAQKFHFAGIEFESQEKAEQNFRTLRGQHKSILSQRDQAATVANQWKAEAEQRASRIAELEAAQGGRGPAVAPPKGTQSPSDVRPGTPAEAEKAFNESVDWDFYKELYETRGPEYAEFWKEGLREKYITDLLQRKIDEATRPAREQQQVTERMYASADLFERAADLADEAGEPYFPELRDPAAQPHIARIFVQMGFDPAADRPEMGVHYAVLAYRDFIHRQARAAGQAPSSSPSTAAPVLGRMSAERDASSQVLSGSGTPRPATPAQTSELQLKRAIREAGQFIPGAGFAP
ncbi:MAG: hypothetical protein A3E78_02000 [Alphaproteobacteria bacterium RIFCSPHIGHO2_12_FULL_63_12]|nr:MAG: hypothetical protein A3E78_02000 [Alphaproteobacteria bacterium RIFCSPHIGHO2_12_FULL_63_12]